MDSSDLILKIFLFLFGAFITLFGNLIASDSENEQEFKKKLYFFIPIIPILLVLVNFITLDNATKVNDLGYYIFAFIIFFLYYKAPNIYRYFKPVPLPKPAPEPGYSVEELENLAINFTKTCKREPITLIGGDFDFLGDTPEDMDRNKQFQDLKQKKSDEIHIVCEKPGDNRENKVRYGKIIKDIQNVKISMYKKPELDPQIRGRMFFNKTGRDGVLFFYRNINKKKSNKKIYIQIEIENDEHLRQHYLNIWRTIEQNISLAKQPERDEWVQCYEEYKKEKNASSNH